MSGQTKGKKEGKRSSEEFSSCSNIHKLILFAVPFWGSDFDGITFNDFVHKSVFAVFCNLSIVSLSFVAYKNPYKITLRELFFTIKMHTFYLFCCKLKTIIITLLLYFCNHNKGS